MTDHSRNVRRAARGTALACAIAVFGLSAISCGERITAPFAGPEAVVVPQPYLSNQALRIADRMADFGLSVDNVRIVLQRLGGSVAADTVVSFIDGVDTLAIELRVRLNGDTEPLDALIEMREDSVVIFAGVQRIVARLGRNTTAPPADSVGLEYVGPGANAVAVRLEAADSTVRFGQVRQLAPVALDSLGQPIPDARFSFERIDGVAGTVDSLGRFTAGTERGISLVRAAVPTGPADTLALAVVPEPSLIRVVSGSGQVAAAGSTLPNPIVFEVIAADLLAVPNVDVTFAVSGGTIPSTTRRTDALGRVETGLTLGTGVGPVTVTATLSGLPSAVATVTSVAGPPVALGIEQQPAASATSGAPLAPAPVVVLRDAFGNRSRVAGVAVRVALTDSSTNALSGPRSVLTDTAGVAAFGGLAVMGPAGTASLRFSADNLTDATSTNITVAEAPATRVVFTDVPPSVAATAPFTVRAEARNAQGLRTTGFTGNVTIALAPGGPSGTLQGTLTRAAVGGIVEFTGLSIATAGVGYRAVVSADGLSADTSGSFTITVGAADSLAAASAAADTVVAN